MAKVMRTNHNNCSAAEHKTVRCDELRNYYRASVGCKGMATHLSVSKITNETNKSFVHLPCHTLATCFGELGTLHAYLATEI